MDLSTTTALVTGANGGIGRHLARELLARGATVYAGARSPDTVDLPGAEALAPDITDPASVAAAVAATGDVTPLRVQLAPRGIRPRGIRVAALHPQLP